MSVDISKFKFPSPSPEGLQVMEMISEVSVDMSILSDVINRDPILAATIMKYANSPIYRRVIEIKSVRKAVNMLGIKNVATAILIATMRGFNTPPTKASESIWEHSMGVAVLARLIAGKLDRSLQDKVEFLATIHDIGAMVMAANLDEYNKVYQSTLLYKACLIESEKTAFGYSHADISSDALAKLKLPEDMTSLINDIHNRSAITQIQSDEDKVLAIISLAHQMEQQIHGDTRVIESMPESIETLISLLNLSQDDLDDISEDFEDILNQGF